MPVNITLRQQKGSPLTFSEVDNNFENLATSADDSEFRLNSLASAIQIANDNLIFSTGNTERARITSSGYFKADPAGTYTGVFGAEPTGTKHAFYSAFNDACIETYAGSNTVNAVAVRATVISGATVSYLYEGRNGQTVNYRVLANGNVQAPAVGSINGDFLLQTAGTERARIDTAGQLGLGTTPKIWTSGVRAFQLGTLSAFWQGQGGSTFLTNNWYRNSAGAESYLTTGFASRYQLSTTGAHIWSVAPSGASDTTITPVEAMTLTQGGNLLVGTTSDTGARLFVGGDSGFRLSNTANDNILTVATGGTFATLNTLGNTTGYIFQTQNTERARITSGGYFKASNNGAYASGDNHEFRQTGAGRAFQVSRTQDSGQPNIRSLHEGIFASSDHYDGVNNGIVVYRVLANGNVQNANNSYGAISDAKLKENVTDATPKLAALNQLRVVNYNLIGSELKQIGLIAQEVEQVFPGLVESTPDTVDVTKTRTVEVPAVLDDEGNEVTPATTREETYTEREPNGEVTKSVKYSILVPMLLKAMQEQQSMIEDLTSRIAALENQ